MNFGVSGNMGACSSQIYRNPITMAAVRRLHGDKPNLTEGQKFILRLRAQKALPKREAEEKWHLEFQNNIISLRNDYLRQCAERNSAIVVSLFKCTEVRVASSPLSPPVGRMTVDYVIRIGCRDTCFTIGDIKGAHRNRKLVALRQKLMVKACVECQHLSLSAIAKIFNRDHTTLLHALRKHGVYERQYHNNPSLAA